MAAARERVAALAAKSPKFSAIDRVIGRNGLKVASLPGHQIDYLKFLFIKLSVFGAAALAMAKRDMQLYPSCMSMGVVSRLA